MYADWSDFSESSVVFPSLSIPEDELKNVNTVPCTFQTSPVETNLFPVILIPSNPSFKPRKSNLFVASPLGSHHETKSTSRLKHIFGHSLKIEEKIQCLEDVLSACKTGQQIKKGKKSQVLKKLGHMEEHSAIADEEPLSASSIEMCSMRQSGTAECCSYSSSITPETVCSSSQDKCNNLLKYKPSPTLKLCQFCEKEFSKLSDLRSHVAIHLNLHQSICEICGKAFSHISNLIRHSRLHSGVKPYLCKVCGKCFTQLSSLKQHEISRHENDPILCPALPEICKKVFRTPTIARQHAFRMHPGIKWEITQPTSSHSKKERSFYCRVCGETFPKLRDLRSHSMLHETKKPKQDVIVETFHSLLEGEVKIEKEVTSSTVEKDIISVVEAEKALCVTPITTETHSCASITNVVENKCSDETNDVAIDSSGRDNEIEVSVLSGKNKAKMTNADHNYALPSRNMLKIKADAQVLKPCSCYLCGKKFTLLSSLQKHQNKHILPFVHKKNILHCMVCGKTFSKLRDIRSHVFRLHFIKENVPLKHDAKTVSKASKSGPCTKRNRTHKVPKVVSKFSSPIFFKKSYAVQKPILCRLCGKRFRLFSSLLQHQTVHFQNKPITCPSLPGSCSKVFYSPLMAKRHMLHMHPELKWGNLMNDVNHIATDICIAENKSSLSNSAKEESNSSVLRDRCLENQPFFLKKDTVLQDLTGIQPRGGFTALDVSNRNSIHLRNINSELAESSDLESENNSSCETLETLLSDGKNSCLVVNGDNIAFELSNPYSLSSNPVPESVQDHTYAYSVVSSKNTENSEKGETSESGQIHFPIEISTSSLLSSEPLCNVQLSGNQQSKSSLVYLFQGEGDETSQREITPQCVHDPSPVQERLMGADLVFDIELTKINHVQLASEACLGKKECFKCGKYFEKSCNLKQHLGTHFPHLQQYTCDVCGLRFSWKSTLNKHVMAQHTQLPQKFLCDICGKQYGNAFQVQEHVRRDHLLLRPHSCHLCPKKFYKKHDLHIHLRFHTKEKPYICKECGCRFVHISHFKRHQLVHNEQHQCDLCGLQFNHMSKLKTHKKSHSL